jgi:DNA-directed RNA polymerase subunit RPC12/RpoP
VARSGRLFKCLNCGHEVRLQAWKAVCPSCESGFTLVPVASEEKKRRHSIIGYVAPILLTIYLVLTLASPSATVSRILPWPTTQLLLVIAIALALTSSVIGNIVASVVGALLTATHLYVFPALSIPNLAVLILSTVLLASGVLNEFTIRRSKAKE